MTSIGTLFAFVVVCAAVLVLRVKRPEARRPFRVPVGPVFPVLGIVSCLYLMLSLAVLTWVRFLVWLNIGMVIYWFYGRQHSPLRDRRGGCAPYEHRSDRQLRHRGRVAGPVQRVVHDGARPHDRVRHHDRDQREVARDRGHAGAVRHHRVVRARHRPAAADRGARHRPCRSIRRQGSRGAGSGSPVPDPALRPRARPASPYFAVVAAWPGAGGWPVAARHRRRHGRVRADRGVVGVGRPLHDGHHGDDRRVP